MTLVLPIVIASILIGAFSKRMTGTLWLLMAMVILITATYFFIRH